MQEKSSDMMNSITQPNSFNRTAQQDKSENNSYRGKSSNYNGSPGPNNQVSSSTTLAGPSSQRRPPTFNSNRPPYKQNAPCPQKPDPPAGGRGRLAITPRGRGNQRNNNTSRSNYNSFGSDHTTFNEKSIAYSKEQYMMANCCFLVSPDYPVGNHHCDPDLSVDWDAVRVVYQSAPLQQLPMCPICMDVPRCARVAPCGHQYCWPCAMRYVRYVDWDSVRDEATAANILRRVANSKKCAICADHIQLDQLKRVVTCAVSTFSVGDEIHMVLMRRQRGSILVTPVADNVSIRCKVKGISPHEEKDLCQQDVVAIQSMHHEAVQDGTRDIAVVCQDLYKEAKIQLEASELLEHNQRCVSALSLSSQELATSSDASGRFQHSSSFSGICYTDAFVDEGSHIENQEPPPPAPMASHRSKSSSASSDETASQTKETFKESLNSTEVDSEFFYQSADGQHIYLHSINWSCIAQEYRSLQNWPREFRARIMQVDNVVIDPGLRKRYRYLCHLPLLCPIQFVEVKLEPPLVSQDTLAQHRAGLQRREDARRKRETWDRQQSERAARQIARQQEEILERQSRNVYAQKNTDLMFDENDFIPLNVAAQSSSDAAMSVSPGSSGATVSSATSFAKVASRPTTVSATPSTAWGTSSSAVTVRNRQPSFTASSGNGRKQSTSADASDVDDEMAKQYAPPPEKGFFTRCSPADFLVNKPQKGKKKK